MDRDRNPQWPAERPGCPLDRRLRHPLDRQHPARPPPARRHPVRFRFSSSVGQFAITGPSQFSANSGTAHTVVYETSPSGGPGFGFTAGAPEGGLLPRLYTTAELTSTEPDHGPDPYIYGVTLRNLGTTDTGTLWFAWDDVPDQNFMPTPPGILMGPPNWQATVTHNGPTDG